MAEDYTAANITHKSIVPANQEHVQSVVTWLDSRTSYFSPDTFADLVKDAPAGITATELQAAFSQLRPRDIGTTGDIRGYYLTALADRVLGEEYDRRFAGSHPTEEEQRDFWENEARIVLERPSVGQYDHFGVLGHNWQRGTLELVGNFTQDEGIGGYMRGGKILVRGNAGVDTGVSMYGGSLEVTGNTGYQLGRFMKGGEIHVHGNTGASVGFGMTEGTITVDGSVTQRAPGTYWTAYGESSSPGIKSAATGGTVSVAGQTY